MKAQMYKEGLVLDFTALAAKSGGDVVEVSGLCGVVNTDVAINLVGSARVDGLVKVEKAQVAIVDGEDVFFDADGNPYGGTAGSGAATNVPCNATGDMWMGTAFGKAAATDTHVYVMLNKLGQKAGRKIGSFSNPESWNGLDEFEELHITSALATSAKPAFRRRVTNSQDQTAGQLICQHVQAYAGSGLDVAEMGGLLVEAGMKGSAGVLLASTEGGYAARMKFEDDYATGGQVVGAPTYTGKVGVLVLQAQLSANPTGHFHAIEVDCQQAGAGTPTPFDSILYVPTGGQNGSIVNLIEFAAASACAVVSAGTYSTADGYFVVKIAGSTYRVPFFAAVD